MARVSQAALEVLIFEVVADVVSPDSIESTVSFGTPVLIGGTVILAANPIESTVSFGTPSLQHVVAPDSIESTVSFGTPSLAPTISPESIASTVSFGTPVLTPTIGPSSIASGVSFGTPALIGYDGATLPPYTIYINGVNVGNYIKRASISRNASIGSGSRSQCSFDTIDRTGAYRPSIDQEVIIYEGTSRFFGGNIEALEEKFYNGTSCNEIRVNCTDYGTICDRRIVGKYYNNITGGFANPTIADITENFLDGTGITYEPSTAEATVGPLGEQLFNYTTATEALNQICDKVNCDWRVDYYKTLRIFPKSTGYANAPYTISDNDGNFDSLTIRTTRAKRRNRQGVKNSQDNRAIHTDTIEAFAGQIAFETTYVLEGVTPIVREDGVEKTVVELDQIGAGGWDYYYVDDGIGVFRSWANPAVGGEVVEIIYPGRLPVIAWAEDAADIAANGKWEAVEEVRDIPDATAMAALASGLLARGKVIPIQATIVSRRAGWEPGQLVTINTTRPPCDETLLIESVDSQEASNNQFFTHTIRASNSQLPRTDRADNFFAKMIERDKRPLDRITSRITFVLAETIEGIENPGLSVGEKQCVRVAEKAGVIRDCVLYFKSSATTPTTDPISIDVFCNGTSIFGDTKANYPAGATTPQRAFMFSEDPLRVSKGDIFTIEVLDADSAAKDGVLELVLLG
jgi:hypothetical protein